MEADCARDGDRRSSMSMRCNGVCKTNINENVEGKKCDTKRQWESYQQTIYEECD